MSTSRSTTIWCDAPGCDARVDVIGDTLRDARIMARDLGWRSAGAFDVCPIGWVPEHNAVSGSREDGETPALR